MPFKKLHSDIREKLDDLEIITPTPFQSKCIPVIKSGTNLFCTAPKDCGKTTTLILTTLQKLKCQAIGNAPRAIVLVENRENIKPFRFAFLPKTLINSLSLNEYLIKTFTNEGDFILDPCFGSGSAIFAAKNINRNYIGFELDSEYYNTVNKIIAIPKLIPNPDINPNTGIKI